MSATTLLDGLNDKQKEAVEITEGPLLIMAGAGSGKTRVLTHRVAYLIEEKDVKPWHILAITFTNKAAREMRERVIGLLDESGQDVWVSTFHSLCVRVLRRDIDRIGYNKAFTITDTGEQRTLVKRILREQNIDPKKYDPRSLLSAISNAKNELQTPKDFSANANTPFEQITATVYEAYQRELKANQALDFDDLIMLAIELFEKAPDVLEFYQRRFEYIHVDEYQDTNDAQYKLVSLLAAKYKNLCVVGDADQSIYGWRGANMNNILDFEKDYPNAQTVMLEQNYRSTQTILNAANGVIENNTLRRKKDLWTDNGSGEKISYYRAQSERDEAHFVIAQIETQMQEHKRNYGDFAILYRTNAQSRTIEDALVKSNIPYNMVGGHKFYDRKEIRDVLAYLTLIVNPQDDMSFERIINEPKRGLGSGSVEKLRDFANYNNWSLLEATQNVAMANTIGGRARNAFEEFGQMMAELSAMREFITVTDLTDQLLKKTGYMVALQSTHSLEDETRIENLQEFMSVTKQFDDNYEPTTALPTDAEAADEVIPEGSGDKFVDFLADLALVSDLDNVDEENGQAVTLMTLHAAKGLEFPIVFLMGLEEGIFPLSRSIMEEDELEEERRLAYVGITRAKEKLYLTNAFSRLLYGRVQNNPASRFVEEINPELLQSENHSAGSITGGPQTPFDKRTASALSTTYKRKPIGTKSTKVERSQGTGADQLSWQAGDKVTHKKWGEGTVVKVNGTGEDAELDIAFPDEGIKRLLAAFAPITKA
ncbi:DNA helicase PcrA [Furfurilactobacillus siliginis]|uniref:ATP-dependent DNA helicase n=1 Tax=Furfurilactobacillus siliginis TaxID=348151 RepID=A0A0R2LB42_9LACO|nr:DNA helicase PcrA [Furfurilactobacillus siliginis]KRN95668.1 ATP-dependent DNA helicase PcrA [Furfurilactobacillus siliginis]GEK28069.1 DNA helicase [Furfurilactobacillus siliginis]